MPKQKRAEKKITFDVPTDPKDPKESKDPKEPSEPPTQPAPHNLLLNENYKEEMNYAIHEILDKYVSLLAEYITFIVEKVALKNTQLQAFILIRGLHTITHVFNGLLFYTKNAELAFYHSQKAFYFYVEFIEQISDTQNSFLKLSSRDAMIFVYKRTLFELHNEFIKQPINIQPFMQALNPYYDIYTQLMCTFIQYKLTTCVNKEQTVTCVGEFAKKIIAFSKRLNYLIVESNTLKMMQSSVSVRYDKDIDMALQGYEIMITKVSKGFMIG